MDESDYAADAAEQYIAQIVEEENKRLERLAWEEEKQAIYKDFELRFIDESEGGCINTRGCCRLRESDKPQIDGKYNNLRLWSRDSLAKTSKAERREHLLGIPLARLCGAQSCFDENTRWGRENYLAFYEFILDLVDVTWFKMFIVTGTLEELQKLTATWFVIAESQDDCPPLGFGFPIDADVARAEGWFRLTKTHLMHTVLGSENCLGVEFFNQYERFRVILAEWIREEHKESEHTGFWYEVYRKTWHWRRTRQKLLAIAGHRCEHIDRNGPVETRCPCRTDLQVHHITYDRVTEEWDDDLIVLCDDHHADIHNKPRRGWRNA